MLELARECGVIGVIITAEGTGLYVYTLNCWRSEYLVVRVRYNSVCMPFVRINYKLQAMERPSVGKFDSYKFGMGARRAVPCLCQAFSPTFSLLFLDFSCRNLSLSTTYLPHHTCRNIPIATYLSHTQPVSYSSYICLVYWLLSLCGLLPNS